MIGCEHRINIRTCCICLQAENNQIRADNDGLNELVNELKRENKQLRAELNRLIPPPSTTCNARCKCEVCR